MMYIIFGFNLTQRVGELANYVFFTKFKMAVNLSRRGLGVRGFLVEQVQLDVCEACVNMFTGEVWGGDAERRTETTRGPPEGEHVILYSCYYLLFNRWLFTFQYVIIYSSTSDYLLFIVLLFTLQDVIVYSLG